MKKCFISLQPDAPEGFEFRTPRKHDLLGTLFALWTDSVNSARSVFRGYEDRVHGLVITTGTTFTMTKIHPALSHLTVPEGLSDIYNLAACFLETIDQGLQACDENENLKIELKQSVERQKETQKTYDNITRQLTSKVKNLNDEIHKRHEIETSLRQQQELMDLTLTASAIGLGMAQHRKIIWANEAMMQLFGMKSNELYGQDTRILYASEEEYRRVGQVLYEKRINQSVVELDAEFKRNDGSLFYGQYRVVYKDPEKPAEGVVVSLVDITERKKAEKALQQSEKRFRDLSEMLPEAIFETDINLNLTFANKRAFELFGYTSEDLRQGLNGIDIIAPADKPRTQENIMRRLKGELVGAVEYNAVKKDGTEFPVLFHATTITEDEDLIGFKGIVVDITERKRIEQQLQQELVQKEILLREVHHRVKNNMNVITSLLSLQSNKIRNKAQALKAFEESKNRIYSMALVHEQLYRNEDFSKMDIKSYIENLSLKLKQIYSSDKIIDLDLDIADVFLDVNHAVPCGLILNELITNAYKHAFKNRKNGHIGIAFHPVAEKMYTMQVEDNGVGLKETVAVENSDTLGLQLVRILTEQLNGQFSVKRINKKTTFSIQFSVDETT